MRFKELRGVMLACLLTILDIILIVISLISQDRAKLMIVLMLSFMIVTSVFMQFYVRLFDDGIICYRSYILALLPQFVSYGDIVNVKIKGKHHLCIETNQKSYHIYVWQASLLNTQLEEKRKSR